MGVTSNITGTGTKSITVPSGVKYAVVAANVSQIDFKQSNSSAFMLPVSSLNSVSSLITATIMSNEFVVFKFD